MGLLYALALPLLGTAESPHFWPLPGSAGVRPVASQIIEQDSGAESLSPVELRESSEELVLLDASSSEDPVPADDDPSDDDNEESSPDCDDTVYADLLSYFGPAASQLLSAHVSPLYGVSIRSRIPRPSGLV